MDAEKKDVLDSLISNLNVLPDTAVTQIARYVDGLKEDYEDLHPVEASIPCPLEEEAFVGIWADRADMNDGAARIRRLRKP